MNIHCLTHSALAGEIHLPDWATGRGHAWSTSLVPEALRLPGPGEVDCLVVLGGPMSAWDDARYPWLAAEKRLLADFLAAGRPVLGICLGAQLLAGVLGARNYPGRQQEIGWHPVHAAEARGHPLAGVLPKRFETFLWHGDTFDLPDGAVRLAGSTAFPNQAFARGTALALQFHLEVRPDWVRNLVARDAEQLVEGGFVQSREQVLGRPEGVYRDNNALMDRLLDRWLAGLGR